MPRVVDADERKKAIAQAALSIARADGLAAVTFRNVAKQMGASSTTVVSHYAPSRRHLVSLMLIELFSGLQELADEVLPTLDATEALEALAEGVLPLYPESRVIAQLGLDAALEFGTKGGVGEGLDNWGRWLHARIGELVRSIGSPLGNEVATDALVAGLAGITLYGLADPQRWTPDRQRGAVQAMLMALGLDSRRTEHSEPKEPS